VEVARCSGCRLCEVVCSFAHENLFGTSFSRMNFVKEDVWGVDFPVICWHCRRCLPMENCPSKALRRNSEGLIHVNEECIGCGKCVEACSAGAIKLHPQRHTPLICDQCDGKPLCVRKCPTKALAYSETSVQRPKLPSEVLEKTLRKWRIVA
jgi:carbon-monoxide dehydrogenase iron sulfur subunit